MLTSASGSSMPTAAPNTIAGGTDGANANRVGRSINMEKALQAVLR